MKDNQKTKKQLIDELDMLRQKVAALEIAGSQPVAKGLRDASKAQQEDNAAKPKRKESRSFQEEKLNFIIEEAGLTLWEWDIEHDCKVFNAIWAEKLGYTLEEYNSSLQEHTLDYFQHPDDIPNAQQAMNDHLIGKAPLYRAEYRMRTKTGDWKWMLALGKISERNAEGKPTHMTGVNLDISERKQAEEALRESEAKNRAILEAIPDRVILYRRDGEFLAVKQPKDYQSTLPIGPRDMIGKNIADLNPGLAPKVLTCLQQAVETGKTQVLEYESMRGDEREYREARYTAINQDEIVAIIRDVTGHKRAEEALRASENKYRLLVDNANEAIFVVQDGMLKFANHMTSEISGYTEQELTSRPFPIFIHPDDRDMVGERHLRRLKGEVFQSRYPFRLITSDGSVKWVEIGAVLIDWEGKPATLNFISDITERKQAEQALQQANERLQATLNALPDLMFEVDREGRIHDWRAPHKDLLYVSPEVFLGKTVSQVLPKEAAEICNHAITQAVEEGRHSGATYSLEMPAGLHWFELSIASKGDPKAPDGRLIVLAHDITERKRAEEQIRRSERELKKAQSVAHVGSWIWDIQNNKLTWSDEMHHIFGISKESFSGSLEEVIAQAIHPDDRQKVEQSNISVIHDKKPMPLEYRIIWPDKTIHTVWAEAGELVLDKTGSPLLLSGIVQDITERKRVEEAIKVSETRYRELFNNIINAVAVYETRNDGEEFIIRDFNHAAERIENVSKEDLIGKSVTEVFPGVREFGLFDIFQRVWRTGKSEHHPISFYQDTRLSGWRENYVYKLPSGEIVAVYEDVTERKRAEEALRQSEERYRLLAETSPEMIFVVNPECKVTYINNIGARSVGKQPSDIIGNRVEDFFPIETATRQTNNLRKVFETGQPLYIENTTVFQEKTLWLDSWLVPIKDAGGSIVSVMGLSHDITERKRAEEALRQGEERFRTLVENIPGEVYRCLPTPPWRILHNSAKIETINGHLVSDFLEGSLLYSDFILSEDLEMVNSALEAGIACKEPFIIEYRICHADGSIHWVSERGRAVYSEQGEPLWLDGVIFDITERKRAEATLRESEERYRSLFENMLDGYAYCRMLYENNEPQDFLYLDVNSAFEALTGLKDVVGRKVSEVIPGIQASNPELFEIYGRVASTGRPERFETYLDTLGFWFSESVYSPERGYFVAVFDNITKRKRLEQELIDRERSYRTLVENLPGAVYRCEPVPPWRTIHVSSEIEVISGFTARDFLENPVLFDSIGFPEDTEMANRAILTGIADKKPYVIEYRIRHVDGSIRWVYEKGRAIYSEQGQPLWLDGVELDITERKQAEEALREAQKLASMGSLAAGMAHEINSPLQVITGITERIAVQLESGQLDEGNLKRDIATVNRSGWNIANIMRSLLTYARESPGQVASYNLNEIVTDTLLLTEHQLKTWSNISILSDLSKNLPPLSCERTQIVQVLINLLTNARDAMPNGGKITIRTRYHAAHNRFELQVSDTGIGIPKEMQKKIFDPFFTTKPVDQGTGLGLSIVFGIVKTHGGDIKVESAPKKGTTFTIYLPKEPIPTSDSGILEEIQGRY